MRTKNKILLSLLGLILFIQFIQPSKNNNSRLDVPSDIFKKYQSDTSTEQLVKQACYDCHSNHTNYPSYFHIQPIGWWLKHHIDEGKEHLNFSEFTQYSAKKADHKLEEIIEVIKEDEMPLKSYTITHNEAKLSKKQREIIVKWADDIRQKITIVE